jgi:hypothetical protein
MAVRLAVRMRGGFGHLFERDRAIDFRLTEYACESECQQTGNDSHEHAPQEKASNHGRRSQWQGKPSR